MPEGADVDLDDDSQRLLTADFEIGHYIREQIVPRAVLYFTGEGLDDEGEEYEDEEGDDDEEDDEDDEGDEGDEGEDRGDNLVRVSKKTAQPECKQQ